MIIAVEQIVSVAVAIKVEPCHAHTDFIAKGNVKHPLCLNRIEIAVFKIGGCTKTVQVRPFRNDIYHARCRIASKQRTLRAAQNLDPVKVEKFSFKQARCQQRRAIKMDGSCGIARHANAQVANAANGKAGAGEIAF